MFRRNIEQLARRHAHFLKPRRKRAWNNDPAALRNRRHLLADIQSNRGKRIQPRQRLPELAQPRFDRVHMIVEQSRQHRLALQVHQLRLRPTLGFEHRGVQTHRRDPTVFHRNRFLNRELRVHRHDLPVMQNEVCIGGSAASRNKRQRGGAVQPSKMVLKERHLIHKGGYVKDILSKEPGTRLDAFGWVKTRRDSKGVHFVQLQDGSSAQDLQVVIEAGRIPEDQLANISTGASLRVTGELVKSPASGQAVELKAEAVEVYGPADPATYPLQKKGHTMEFLRDITHLRTRSNTFRAVFRVRNALSMAIHRFYQENGFIWVHAPLITTSDTEGAGAMFGVTTLDMMNLPRTAEGRIDFAQDFFGKPAFLTVSGQLEAEIFALAFSNVYTFGPTFRAENSNTPRHLAEFWMVEPEMAFCDLDDNRRLAESFLKFIIRDVLDHCGPDLEFFNKRIDNTVLATLEHVAESDFEHLTYTEAVRILEHAKDVNGSFPCSGAPTCRASTSAT